MQFGYCEVEAPDRRAQVYHEVDHVFHFWNGSAVGFVARVRNVEPICMRLLDRKTGPIRSEVVRRRVRSRSESIVCNTICPSSCFPGDDAFLGPTRQITVLQPPRRTPIHHHQPYRNPLPLSRIDKHATFPPFTSNSSCYSVSVVRLVREGKDIGFVVVPCESEEEE